MDVVVDLYKKNKCPICFQRNYQWAIKDTIWKSEKCWSHLSFTEKEDWKKNLLIYLKANGCLTSAEEEQNYFRQIFLKKYWNNYLKIYQEAKSKDIYYLKKYKKHADTRQMHHESQLSAVDFSIIEEQIFDLYISYKKDNPIVHNLQEVDLCNLDLTNFDFNNADFSWATLTDVNFSGSKLRNANFTKANLENLNFTETDLTHGNFCASNIIRTSYKKALLENSEFESANIENVDFTECFGAYASLKGVNFINSTIVSSRLQYAVFSEANISMTNFEGSQMIRTKLDNCTANNISFSEANLENAYMNDSDFSESKFCKANLSNSIINNSDLSESDLTFAELEGAQVAGTNFFNADLRNANLRNVDLYLAKLNNTHVFYEDIQSANILVNQLMGDCLMIERKVKTRVFISYSHSDATFAIKLEQALTERSIDVWIDRKEILVGDSLIERIREGIDTSQFVCAIISKNSAQSKWVQNELDIAMNQQIQNKVVKVLPLIVEPNVELPLFLIGKLYIDFSKNEYFANGVEQIMRRLNH